MSVCFSCSFLKGCDTLFALPFELQRHTRVFLKRETEKVSVFCVVVSVSLSLSLSLTFSLCVCMSVCMCVCLCNRAHSCVLKMTVSMEKAMEAARPRSGLNNTVRIRVITHTS